MPFPSRRLPILAIALLAISTAAGDLEEALARNDFAAAEEELEQLASDWRSALADTKDGQKALELGRTLQALGIVERQAGKSREALPHLEEAADLLSLSGAADHADALEALALTLQDLGRAGDAEAPLREVIRLRESLPPEQREPSLSLGRDHLGLNLLTQGKYADADEIIRRALTDTPADDPEARARRLGYSGRYLHTMGNHARAVATFQEALSLPFPNPELKLSLESQLALALLRLGKTSEAREGMEKTANDAAALYAGEMTAFHAAPYLNNLGALDLAMGNALQANAAFAEALQMLEKSLGTDHPSLIPILNNLGCADQAAGNYDSAEQSFRRAASLQAKYLPPLHLRVAETTRNLARNAVLSGKQDALAEIDRATALGTGLLDELIARGSEQERLNFLQRLDLVSLPCATGDAGRIADVLAATKARLLDSMLASPSGPPSANPKWQTLQASLKPGCALVDTCRYMTVSDEPEERYGAVVILPSGPPKWIPLGSAADLQQGLDSFRKRLSWKAATLAGENPPAPALKLRGILRSLHDGFWDPVAKALPAEIRHIAFSPDGALHFLPLPVLLDGQMSPLVSRYLQVTTITSSRDLLGQPSEVKLSSSPWTVLGVSEFPKRKQDSDGDRLLALLENLDDMPGTAEEMKRLRELAPAGSHFLRDAKATEKALLDMPAHPGVLHLGCHAFFLPGSPGTGDPVDFDENAGLLFSGGLLLHGAALRSPHAPPLSPEDDLLYPSEIAGLPLRGTRLVTLSSCESGAGTAVSGEGLLGLRRGFALAGAREVLVALWPVSDRSTPEFMERFYRLAQASDRSGQALWQCQREFLTSTRNDDDFEAAVLRYAPFVLSQNEPLATGPEITLAEKTRMPWKLAWLGLPLLVFLAMRLGMARKNKQSRGLAQG